MDIYKLCFIIENIIITLIVIYVLIVNFLYSRRIVGTYDTEIDKLNDVIAGISEMELEEKEPVSDTGKLTGKQETEGYDEPHYW